MEMTLKDFLNLMFQKWWLLLICLAIGGAGTFIAVKVLIDPQYRSDAVFLINYNTPEAIGGSGNSSQANSDLTYSKNLVANFVEILNQNTFRYELLDEMRDTHNAELDEEKIIKMISFGQEVNTSKLVVSITSASKETSFQLATIVQNKVEEYIQRTFKGFDDKKMSISIINTVEKAKKPVASYDILYGLVGGLAALALAIVVIVLIDKFDVRVKSEKELVTLYHLPVLGVVPAFDAGEKKAREEKANEKAV